MDSFLLPKKLIINVALTGMIPQKADTPYVPISPEEIVRDAKSCYDEGATVMHVHARNSEGYPVWHHEIYREIVGGIRRSCPGVLVCTSTSGRIYREFSERSDSLKADPDFGSLTLGSLNFPKQASVTQPEMITDLALAMRDRKPKRIVPELEVFDLGMVSFMKFLIDKGVLVPPFYCNILLGSLGTLSAEPHHLIAAVRDLPHGTIWSAAGIGRYQSYVNNLAIALGGHVRVGLEDNLYEDSARRVLATNVGLVRRVVAVAKALNRDVASPAEAREIIFGSHT